MSYFKSEEATGYPDGDGGLTLHTNSVIDQGAGHLPRRYLVKVSETDFRSLVREILARTAPEWVKPPMINAAVEKFFEGEKL